jgi:hypothetical protein
VIYKKQKEKRVDRQGGKGKYKKNYGTKERRIYEEIGYTIIDKDGHMWCAWGQDKCVHGVCEEN